MLTNVEVYSSWASAPDLPLQVGVAEDEDPLQIRGIDGIGPVKATVNTTQNAQRGSTPTGTLIGQRNIVMTIGFNPDWVNHTVASLRDKLYGYFMTEQPVTLRLFRDDGPAVTIDGEVESCDPDIFSQDPQVVVSIICPKPDFVAISPSYVEGAAQLNPAASVDFTAVSNVETSVLLEVTAPDGDATNYEGRIVFERKTLRPDAENFTFAGTVGPGVLSRINSELGNKYVQVDYGAEQVGALNTMTDDSVWPRITPGTNRIRVLLPDLAGGIAEKHWKLTYYDRFGGL